jgi:hypothetical protein
VISRPVSLWPSAGQSIESTESTTDKFYRRMGREILLALLTPLNVGLSDLLVPFRTSFASEASVAALNSHKTEPLQDLVTLCARKSSSAVWLDAELFKTLPAIRARKGKRLISFCALDKFLGPSHIVSSISDVSVKDWPSALPTGKRTESEQAQVQKNLENQRGEFHVLFAPSSQNTLINTRGAMFISRQTPSNDTALWPGSTCMIDSAGRQSELL